MLWRFSVNIVLYVATLPALLSRARLSRFSPHPFTDGAAVQNLLVMTFVPLVPRKCDIPALLALGKMLQYVEILMKPVSHLWSVFISLLSNNSAVAHHVFIISPCKQQQGCRRRDVFNAAAVSSACWLHSLRSGSCSISCYWLPQLTVKWQIMRQDGVWSSLRSPASVAKCRLLRPAWLRLVSGFSTQSTC